jgi:hypothetical protein
MTLLMKKKCVFLNLVKNENYILTDNKPYLGLKIYYKSYFKAKKYFFNAFLNESKSNFDLKVKGYFFSSFGGFDTSVTVLKKCTPTVIWERAGTSYFFVIFPFLRGS